MTPPDVRQGTPYDQGPVAALRRVAFLMERGREETRRVQAFRNAAATLLPLADDEVADRVEAGTLTELAGIGPSTAAVIEAAVRGEVPERLAKLEREYAGPLTAGREGPPRGAARRPALPLGLVRRRLADRGDGLHRDGARPRVPRAHRPLAAPDRGQRAQPGPAHQAARGRRRGQPAPRRLRLHAAEGDRGRHPRRRWSRPDRGDAGAARGPGGERALQAAPGRGRDDHADARRDPQPVHQRARPLHGADGDGQPRDAAEQPSSTRRRSSRPASSTTSRSRSTPAPSGGTRRRS